LANEGSNKGTVLTAKPLEWIRIKQQLDADETLGELADPRGSPDSPAARLANVLRLEDALRGVGPLLQTKEGWKLAKATLDAPSFQTKAFKKAFNAYSDNVYYSKNDPDRANLYLLGGTPPSAKQTIQYLHRNDALDSVESLRSEIDYLLANPGEGVADAKAYHAAGVKAFDEYFALCPPEDAKAARAIVGPGGPGARP